MNRTSKTGLLSPAQSVVKPTVGVGRRTVLKGTALAAAGAKSNLEPQARSDLALELGEVGRCYG